MGIVKKLYKKGDKRKSFRFRIKANKKWEEDILTIDINAKYQYHIKPKRLSFLVHSKTPQEDIKTNEIYTLKVTEDNKVKLYQRGIEVHSINPTEDVNLIQMWYPENVSENVEINNF